MSTRIFTIALTTVIALSSCKKEGCTDESAINYNSKAKKTGEWNYFYDSGQPREINNYLKQNNIN